MRAIRSKQKIKLWREGRPVRRCPGYAFETDHQYIIYPTRALFFIGENENKNTNESI